MEAIPLSVRKFFLLIFGGGVALTFFLGACSDVSQNPMALYKKEQMLRICIYGDIDEMESKDDIRQVELVVVDEYGNKTSYPVQIKIQGSSSIKYEKKNYNITFFEDYNYDQKQKVDIGLGLGEQSKWTLKANWIDKSHSRNIVSARIAGDINERYGKFEESMNYGVVDGFPVELYNNDEFWGIYTFNIAKGDWLWGIDDSVYGQVVIEGRDWKEATAFNDEIKDFTEDDGWRHEEGIYDDETIANFNAMVRFIKDSTDEEFRAHFNEYMDLDATLNYLVMLHLFAGIDNTNSNLILVTTDNGLSWTPDLYDMDSTWGTYWDGSLYDYDFLPYYTSDSDTTHPVMISNLWRRVIDNFPDELSTRWFELRKDILSERSLKNYFEAFKNSIGDAAYLKDNERWPDQPGYMVDQIEEFIEYRLPFIDDYMDSLSE